MQTWRKNRKKFQDRIGKSRKDLIELQKILSPIQFREVFLTILGIKVSRVLLTESELLSVHPIFKEQKIFFHFLTTPIYSKVDTAKGHWSSYFSNSQGTKDSPPLYITYIAQHKNDIFRAMEFESQSNHSHFGKLMQIPECCIKAFEKSIGHWKQLGYDPIKTMMEQSPFSLSLNPWCNIFGQYFDYSLLSFMPCSFQCQEAAKFSEFTLSLLTDYNRSLAEEFSNYLFSAFIYSEYMGVFRFKTVKITENNSIFYESSSIEATDLDNELANYLFQGNNIRATGFHDFQVYNGSTLLKDFNNKHTSILIFSHEAS